MTMKLGACGPRVGTGARLAEDDSLGDMIQVTANARDYSSKNVAAIFSPPASGRMGRLPQDWDPEAADARRGRRKRATDKEVSSCREVEKLLPELLVPQFEKG